MARTFLITATREHWEDPIMFQSDDNTILEKIAAESSKEALDIFFKNYTQAPHNERLSKIHISEIVSDPYANFKLFLGCKLVGDTITIPYNKLQAVTSLYRKWHIHLLTENIKRALIDFSKADLSKFNADDYSLQFNILVSKYQLSVYPINLPNTPPQIQSKIQQIHLVNNL